MRKKKTPPPIFEKNVLNGIDAVLAEFAALLQAAICERMQYTPKRYQEIKDKNIMLEGFWNSTIMDVFDDVWVEAFNKLQPYRSSLRLGLYVIRTQTEPYTIDNVPKKYWPFGK